MRGALKFFNFKNKQDTESLNLPDLLIEADKIANILNSGSHGRRKPGLGEKFWQYRSYRVGDDVKHIDWRQSAKSDKVFIRQFEWEAAQTAIFWIDPRKSMFTQSPSAPRSKYKFACLIALTLSRAITKSGENIATFNDFSIRPGHSVKLLNQLASLWGAEKGQKQTELPDLIPSQKLTNATAILITDAWDDLHKLGEQLKSTRKACDKVLLIQIHDPIEILLDYKGAVKFEPFDKSDSLLFQNVTDIRKAYQKRVSKHLNDVAKLSKSLGIYHLHYRTDYDLLPILENSWRVLAEK